MRLQIDAHTAKQLDALRKAHPEIPGGGHLPTIRWLLDYYRAAGDLTKIKADIETITADIVDNMPTWIRAATEEALKNLVTNSLAAFLPAAFRRTAGGDVDGTICNRGGRPQDASPAAPHSLAAIDGTPTRRKHRRT